MRSRTRLIVTALALAITGGASGQPLVSGYYPAWLQDVLPPYQVNFQIVGEVRHAFGWPDSTGNLITADGIPDGELAGYADAAGAPLLLSVGGTENSQHFSTVVADPPTRYAFAARLAQFCWDNDYDGIDLDWEFPSSPADRDSLTVFVHELRTALDLLDPEYRITMAVPADESLLAWYDFDALGVERGAPAAPALPGRITLAAPYPNPFNGTVRISYTVPRPGRVLIEVSDVLGRRVARFRDEISRAGEHEISWQAEAAPAGVYFLTVHVAGGGRAAAKLVLVR